MDAALDFLDLISALLFLFLIFVMLPMALLGGFKNWWKS